MIPGLRSLRSLTRGYNLPPLRGSLSQTCGAIGAAGFKYFLFWLSGFYLVIAVSELIFRKQTRRVVLMYTDLVCCFGLAAWGILLIILQWSPHQWMVPLTLFVLALLRIKAWKTIVFRSM